MAESSPSWASDAALFTHDWAGAAMPHLRRARAGCRAAAARFSSDSPAEEVSLVQATIQAWLHSPASVPLAMRIAAYRAAVACLEVDTAMPDWHTLPMLTALLAGPDQVLSGALVDEASARSLVAAVARCIQDGTVGTAVHALDQTRLSVLAAAMCARAQAHRLLTGHALARPAWVLEVLGAHAPQMLPLVTAEQVSTPTSAREVLRGIRPVLAQLAPHFPAVSLVATVQGFLCLLASQRENSAIAADASQLLSTDLPQVAAGAAGRGDRRRARPGAGSSRWAGVPADTMDADREAVQQAWDGKQLPLPLRDCPGVLTQLTAEDTVGSLHVGPPGEDRVVRGFATRTERMRVLGALRTIENCVTMLGTEVAQRDGERALPVVPVHVGEDGSNAGPELIDFGFGATSGSHASLHARVPRAVLAWDGTAGASRLIVVLADLIEKPWAAGLRAAAMDTLRALACAPTQLPSEELIFALHAAVQAATDADNGVAVSWYKMLSAMGTWRLSWADLAHITLQPFTAHWPGRSNAIQLQRVLLWWAQVLRYAPSVDTVVSQGAGSWLTDEQPAADQLQLPQLEAGAWIFPVAQPECLPMPVVQRLSRAAHAGLNDRSSAVRDAAAELMEQLLDIAGFDTTIQSIFSKSNLLHAAKMDNDVQAQARAMCGMANPSKQAARSRPSRAGTGMAGAHRTVPPVPAPPAPGAAWVVGTAADAVPELRHVARRKRMPTLRSISERGMQLSLLLQECAVMQRHAARRSPGASAGSGSSAEDEPAEAPSSASWHAVMAAAIQALDTAEALGASRLKLTALLLLRRHRKAAAQAVRDMQQQGRLAPLVQTALHDAGVLSHVGAGAPSFAAHRRALREAAAFKLSVSNFGELATQLWASDDGKLQLRRLLTKRWYDVLAAHDESAAVQVLLATAPRAKPCCTEFIVVPDPDLDKAIYEAQHGTGKLLRVSKLPAALLASVCPTVTPEDDMDAPQAALDPHERRRLLPGAVALVIAMVWAARNPVSSDELWAVLPHFDVAGVPAPCLAAAESICPEAYALVAQARA